MYPQLHRYLMDAGRAQTTPTGRMPARRARGHPPHPRARTRAALVLGGLARRLDREAAERAIA